MLAQKKILAVVAARGGSKGLPRKNLKILAGKPLIAWSIDEAMKSRYIDTVIVSSEDLEILEVARRFGAVVPFVRPVELATDGASGTAAVLHAVETLTDYDYVVLLQPTSPLRTVQDIDSCLELAIHNGAVSVVSVTQCEKSVYWACTIDASRNNRIQFLFDEKNTKLRRQELPTTYVLNGAIYVAQCGWLRATKKLIGEETLCYEMPRDRSVDIDTEMDLIVAEALINVSTGGDTSQ